LDSQFDGFVFLALVRERDLVGVFHFLGLSLGRAGAGSPFRPVGMPTSLASCRLT
jgi:hypothetical protein